MQDDKLYLTEKNTDLETEQEQMKRAKKDTYRIIDMQKKHFSDIFRIADHQLGQDYVTDELLEKCIHEDSPYIGRTAINKHNHRVLGFCISFSLESSALSDLLNMDDDAIPSLLSHADDLGVIKTIAVDKKLKGYGIGTHLINDALHVFKEINRKTVFTIAWKSKLGINLHGVLMKTHFQRLIEIPHYWYQSSLETGCHCSVCGQPPCVCSAVIYAKKIK